jgi:outer membrane beta-barrel protein
MTNANSRRFALLVALLVTALPLAAQAQRRSPLADAPAIRKRLELRQTRFEIGAGFGSTIGQDFYHTMMVSAKLGFHITDWLSLSGVGGFAVSNLATGFQERVVETLPGMPNAGLPREPTSGAAQASMDKIKMMGAAQLEFTPFTGKYSMFGKIFAHYDFYFFGGVGALSFEPTNTAALAGCAPRCVEVSGWKPGGNVGVGLHTFFNQFVALNVELRDIIAQTNYSGRDVNGDDRADTADLTWASTYMFAANIVLFLPSVAAISQ